MIVQERAIVERKGRGTAMGFYHEDGQKRKGEGFDARPLGWVRRLGHPW